MSEHLSNQAETPINKKYEITKNILVYENVTLYQIRALKNFTLTNLKYFFTEIKKGDLGGWIETEDNLSQEDTCWILNNAKVFGNATICDDAIISDNAKAYGSADIGDNVLINGNAKVFGDTYIGDDAIISDNAKVFGNACISGKTRIVDNARVYGNACVYGHVTISDNASVCGNAKVTDYVHIADNASVDANILISGGYVKISGSTKIYNSNQENEKLK